ncbi:MAG: SGNH/GDSL hydrolase family protein [Phycisphaerales bacterium]|nr:SGNH/GDSL hydrolase family protein [Phycisphaerales bacterium]
MRDCERGRLGGWLRASALAVIGAVVSMAGAGGGDCDLESARPLMFGIDEATARFYNELAQGREASVMIVGDSISYRANSYNWFLRDHLHTVFGNGGEGYFAIGDGFSKSPNGNSARVGQLMREQDLSPDNIPAVTNLSGNVRWLAANSARPLPWGAWSPDGIYTHIDGPGAIELDFYGTSATLHYLRIPDGAAFRMWCNGNYLGLFSAATPVGGRQLPASAWAAPLRGGERAVIRPAPLAADEFAARVRHASIDFDTGALDNDTLNTVRIEWAGGGLLQLNGLEMRSGVAGASYMRVARGGQGPRDFLGGVNKVVGAQLIAMRPDLLIVMLDWSSYDERETFEADTNALLDFYQKALPDTPIILMTHHPFITDIELEADLYRKIACERGVGYINLFDLFSGWSEMWSLGFMFDSTHLTATGGAWFGAYVFDVLTTPLN